MSPMLWWYTCHLGCARMYVYVISCVRICLYMGVCLIDLNLYIHEYIHMWIWTSTFWVSRGMTPNFGRYICHLVCVRVYVYVCVFYIVSFVRTHVHTYMNPKFKILGLLTNDLNFMMIYMPSSVCARICLRLCVCNSINFEMYVNVHMYIQTWISNSKSCVCWRMIPTLSRYVCVVWCVCVREYVSSYVCVCVCVRKYVWSCVCVCVCA